MTPYREIDGPGDPDAALTSSMRQLTLFGKPVKRTNRQLEREAFWDSPSGKGEEMHKIILPAGTVSEPSLAEERALKQLPDDEAMSEANSEEGDKSVVEAMSEEGDKAAFNLLFVILSFRHCVTLVIAMELRLMQRERDSHSGDRSDRNDRHVESSQVSRVTHVSHQVTNSILVICQVSTTDNPPMAKSAADDEVQDIPIKFCHFCHFVTFPLFFKHI